MNITIIADPFIPVPPIFYGGIERIIDLLISELLRFGHNVTLFAHKDSEVTCKHIPYTTDKSGLKNDLLNTWLINKYLSANKVDVIHNFGRLAYLLPQLHKSVPKLMSYQREPTLKQIKRAVLLSRKNSITFTGCSDYITKQISPFAPTYTIYNGVDTAKYNAHFQVADNAPLVFLGRIEPIKGPHIAIEMALATGKTLTLAGNIPNGHESYFNEKIKPFLNDKIQYVGPVNDYQKNEILGKALALLMPIEWNEPFGIVMVEAMACGTPVIGFKRGAVPEVIENGITGYYADSAESLKEYITKIHHLDRLVIRKTAETRFSSVVIAGNYLNLYKKLIDSR